MREIEEIYHQESRRVFATLVRLLGDLDLAEEALHDSFTAALERWPREGIPRNPRSWLVSAGRFKAIDKIRRKNRFEETLPELVRRQEEQDAYHLREEEELEDDRLRLIFTCCHPALPANAQIALTLREVCGLTTEAIASAFLTTTPAMAQRIVRGKARIREAQIPYQVPAFEELPDRLDTVLSVIYLVFSEGYAASEGEALTRPDLSQEAIRLGRLLVSLLPDAEALGLLALMLLQESRRSARTGPEGEIILLEDQDRRRWDRVLIEEGLALVERALQTDVLGAYTLQAAIAAEHARAGHPNDTNWRRIVALYDLLTRAMPTPIVELNRAVALAMRAGPQAGLDIIDAILRRGQLQDYHLAHAARADLLRRLGRGPEARLAYQDALRLSKQGAERRFLERRLHELQKETVG